ncbi:membrane-spanning 4-domains subfamily A member 10 [Trichechus inunguis]
MRDQAKAQAISQGSLFFQVSTPPAPPPFASPLGESCLSLSPSSRVPSGEDVTQPILPSNLSDFSQMQACLHHSTASKLSLAPQCPGLASSIVTHPQKTLCLTMNLISFFCVFCCIFVIVMDLFLESPYEAPIWSTYPNSTVHIQRLELAMLCFTYLELFLPGPTAVVAWRIHRLSAEVKMKFYHATSGDGPP